MSAPGASSKNFDRPLLAQSGRSRECPRTSLMCHPVTDFDSQRSFFVPSYSYMSVLSYSVWKAVYIGGRSGCGR